MNYKNTRSGTDRPPGTTPSGIRISNSIDLSLPKSNIIINRLCILLITFMGIIGTVFSFLTQFHTSVSNSSAFFYCLLFFTLFALIFSLPRRFHLTVIPLLGIYSLLLWYNWDKFITGFKILFNEIYCEIYEYSTGYFKIKAPKSDNAELFIAFVIFLICSALCCALITRPNLFSCFAFSFPFVEIGLYYGKTPSVFFGAMLVLFWIVTGALCCCGYYQKFDKNSSGFMRSGSLFIAKPGIKFYTTAYSAAAAACIGILIFLLTFIYMSVSGYERPERLNDIRSDLKLAAREFNFDDIGKSLDRIYTSLGFGNSKIYTHKLGGNVRFKHVTDLTVRSDGIPDSNIYLKGYTAEVYTSEEWKKFDNDVYSPYKRLFERFADDKRFPQDLLTERMLKSGNRKLIEMEITAAHDDEPYNYLPYVSVPHGMVTYSADSDMTLESRQNYSFLCGAEQVDDDNISGILSDPLDESNDLPGYSDFVYKNYLSVPDNDSMKRLYKTFIKGHSLDLDYGRDQCELNYDKLRAIKKILTDNTEYDLSPGTTPDSEDFVEYFLTKSHKGYCVHYATAGIILARLSGIPARYADGYVMLQSDFSDMNRGSDGTYTIDIEDSRGHAWAEVYFPGIGWIPYDFTPSSAEALGGSGEPEAVTTTAVTTAAHTTATTVSHTSVSADKNSTDRHTDPTGSNTTSSVTSEKETEEDTGTSPLLILILMFAGGIVLTAAFITGRYVITRSGRVKILDSPAIKPKIMLYYEMCEQLLAAVDMSRENTQYMEYAGAVDRNLYEQGFTESFAQVTDIMLKCQLSGGEQFTDEYLITENYYKKLRAHIFGNANIFKKAYLQYIRLL